MHTPGEPILLDPTAPRTVTLHDRGRILILKCRPIEKADWLKYFEDFRLTSEQTDEGRVTAMDYQTASIGLAERVFIGAEGYKVGGGAELTSLPNWQTRIPLQHRLQLGVTLTDAVPSAQLDDEFEIQPEAEVVSIDAVWPSPEGKMLKFTGLKHIFRTPTAAQHKRYRDAASRSLVVGGSRTGKTIFLGAHAALVALYDETIVRTEGYAPHTVEQMDAYHKYVAAKELFDPTATASVASSEPARA